MADPVDSLMNATGVVAVARAAGATADTERARGAPPYLVYYRGSLEAGEIRGLGFEGEVSEPGEWGRLLNGGASLEGESRRVELLYRDLEVVEHWVAEAAEGATSGTRWRAGWRGCPPTCSPASSPQPRRWRESCPGRSSRTRSASPRRRTGGEWPPAR
ncbi:MAG: hypothetical protein AABM66_05715 [Actinomycetota bacterium]